MSVTHEPWLVALSLIVAVQGAYVGLSLGVQGDEATGLRRRLTLAAAAVSLAVAIWAMHFVAMLAARLPFSVDYLVLPTLLSFLVCVIVVGAAVVAVTAGPLTPVRLSASAVFLGGGIATMHYIGMTALHASAHMDHDPRFVAASVAIAIGASGLALWLAEGRRRPPLAISAVAFGMAISGMHYTAMAGLTLFPHVNPGSTAPALSADLLAIVVAIVAFLMSGVFLLLLVPERSAAEWAGAQQAKTETPIVLTPTPGSSREELGPDLIRTGGERAAFLLPATTILATQSTDSPVVAVGNGRWENSARHLPIERDGVTQYVPVDDIVAVHANAHYTYVFDGAAKLFCPLAISDVEARLDRSRFVRVHRSHIVNLSRVVGLKRAGDNGVIELAGLDRYTVPVSRSRFGGLRTRLEVGSGAVAG
jgi:NO-binding membrane sensor protein with MHYT domain